jgi:type II secretory pathway component GspD/PulD (secretin)
MYPLGPGFTEEGKPPETKKFEVSISAVSENVAPSSSEATPAEPRISMDFQDANLKDVLKIFSQQAGLSFVASEDVQEQTVTLYMDGVSVEDALNTILKANNLTYEKVKDTNIFIVKARVGPTVETQTRIYPLKHASVSESVVTSREEGESGIKAAIEKILTQDGKISEDIRTNSLIVTDIPSQFELIEETISKLDVPVPQVMIEVEILDTTKKLVDNLGINWSGAFGTYTGPTRETYWPFSQFAPPGPHGWDFTTTTTVGTMDFSGLTAAINFLTEDKDTRFLARPRILTLSNETAEINITTNEAIGQIVSQVSTEGIGTSTSQAERVDTGVQLKVTPQVNAQDGIITMVIEPSVTEAVTGGTFSGITYKDPEQRSAKAVLKIRDGETIVMGGLLRSEEEQTIRKIPLLGDIPIVGMLFKQVQRTHPEERELVVFITPHIVDEGEKDLFATPLREQELLKTRQEEISQILDQLESQERYLQE